MIHGEKNKFDNAYFKMALTIFELINRDKYNIILSWLCWRVAVGELNEGPSHRTPRPFARFLILANETSFEREVSR